MTVDKLIEYINFLIHNIYIRVGNKVFKQAIGIPMGTDCALLLANLFLFFMNKLQKKHFTKMQKHVGLASTKKPTKQDGTHMTIRSQISIPTSIFPTTPTIIPYSLFWNGCVYLCVVNSRIGLWGLWVGVCIEGSRE